MARKEAVAKARYLQEKEQSEAHLANAKLLEEQRQLNAHLIAQNCHFQEQIRKLTDFQ